MIAELFAVDVPRLLGYLRANHSASPVCVPGSAPAFAPAANARAHVPSSV